MRRRCEGDFFDGAHGGRVLRDDDPPLPNSVGFGDHAIELSISADSCSCNVTTSYPTAASSLSSASSARSRGRFCSTTTLLLCGCCCAGVPMPENETFCCTAEMQRGDPLCSIMSDIIGMTCTCTFGGACCHGCCCARS